MLDTGPQSVTFDELWQRLPIAARAPSSDFLHAAGPAPVHPSDKRRFIRFRCRKKVILRRKSEYMAGYMVDVSRSGVAILSPLQLLPHEDVELIMKAHRYSLRVVTCVRIGERCFRCGCVFRPEDANVVEAESPEQVAT